MGFMQVAYMPYIESTHFEFGNLGFLPYYHSETKKQISPEIIEYLDWYFPKYVDIAQNPLKLTLVSYKGKLIDNWTAEQIQEMYDTVAVLCFLSTWHNISFGAVSTDNFIMYIKNFTPGDKALAVSAGSYINTNTLYSTDVCQKILFVKPEFIPSWSLIKNPWLNDTKLFAALSNALTTAYSDEWFNVVLRSIKIYNTAYVNNYLGIFDRILLLVTAFESLFMEETSSQEKLGNALVRAIGAKKDIDEFAEINEKIKGLGKKLYEIRSRYAHGKQLPSTIRHDVYGDLFKTGVYAYALSVKSILEEKGFIQYSSDTSNYFNPDNIRVLTEIHMGLFSVMNESSIELEE